MNFSRETTEEGSEYLAVSNEELFRQIPISQWQGQDCEQWVQSLMNSQGNYYDGSILWKFKDITGHQLLQFTKQDFITLAGRDFGRYLFKELQHLRRTQREMNMMQQQSEISQGESLEDPFLRYNTSPSQDFSTPIPGGFQHQNIGGRYNDPDIDLLETFPEVEVSDYENLDVGLLEEILDEVNLEDMDDLSQLDSSESGSSSHQEESYLQNQYTDDYRSESFPEDAISPSTSSASAMSIPSEHLSNIPVGHRRRERGPKSWEFLMRLLADPRTNPTFIKWEDEATGAFRLMQPEAIARTWASRNEKGTDLSYNNFARAIRYHYPSKVLFPIREKQMVYGCGPKALKFLEDLRNSSR